MTVNSAAIKLEVTGQTQYAIAYAAQDVNGIQAIYNSVSVLGAADLTAIDQYLKTNYVLSTDSIPAYWSIKNKAAGTVQPQAQLSQMVLDIFTSKLNSVDFTLTTVTNLMVQCVAAGVFSTQIQTDLLALDTKPRNMSITDLAFALYNPDGTKK